MIRKAKIEERFEINTLFDDAKALFKSQGSTQWQDLDGYPNISTIEKDINNGHMFVKIRDDKIVGVMALTKEFEEAYRLIYDGAWLNDDEYYVVHRIAVKKEFYGRGIAKELLRFADEECIRDGVYNIKVDTMEENKIMCKLLLDSGYIKCGTIYLLRKDVIEKKRTAFQKHIAIHK